MATILRFPIQPRRSTGAKPPPRGQASAEIIIFPGVRIQRGTPVLVGPAPAGRTVKPKRTAKRGKSRRPVDTMRDRLEFVE